MTRATKNFFEEFRKEIKEGQMTQPDNTSYQATNKEGEEYLKQLPYEMCEALMITIKNRNAEIAKLSEENKELKAERERLSKEWETYKNDKANIIKQARTEAIHELVEQIVIYAEDKPIGVADIIKTLLLTKHFNHHISDECLTEELRLRIDNLGKKEQTNIIISSQNTNIKNSHIDNFYE